MYDSKLGAYIGTNPVKWFRISIWDMSVLVKAGSRGAARYEAWLGFSDAYDISFKEFLKQSKCLKA